MVCIDCRVFFHNGQASIQKNTMSSSYIQTAKRPPTSFQSTHPFTLFLPPPFNNIRRTTCIQMKNSKRRTHFTVKHIPFHSTDFKLAERLPFIKSRTIKPTMLMPTQLCTLFKGCSHIVLCHHLAKRCFHFLTKTKIPTERTQEQKKSQPQTETSPIEIQKCCITYSGMPNLQRNGWCVTKNTTASSLSPAVFSTFN